MFFCMDARSKQLQDPVLEECLGHEAATASSTCAGKGLAGPIAPPEVSAPAVSLAHTVTALLSSWTAICSFWQPSYSPHASI